MDLQSRIAETREKALQQISACVNSAELEEIKSLYLGRKGIIRDLLSQLSNIPPDSKGHYGAEINKLKDEISQRIESATVTEGKPVETQGAPLFDVTLPGKKILLGRRHPVYKTLDEMKYIFEKLGFDVVYGPEIENEYNNFEALNIPLDHPSRDAFDTFYIGRDTLLRSHTSPVQIRTMKERKPPLRIIAPGKVFRPDTPDASHSPMFHQVEGLMVGEDVTFANLKGILELFAKEMFGVDTKMRFRPSFFPFTEPSAEVDISCIICGGRGIKGSTPCSACKATGWMEILGSGMVHPKVFEKVGYDPEKYTGFAFGMGVE
ncbi:MAG: phenylalanine--tRNA ligase subunit alpha, partial [Planctomycetes bacterium RBG_16_43_13]